MNKPLPTDIASPEALTGIEEHVHARLTGLVGDFQLLLRDGGFVLRGRVHTYYAKQLAQHLAVALIGWPVVANEIQVT